MTSTEKITTLQPVDKLVVSEPSAAKTELPVSAPLTTPAPTSVAVPVVAKKMVARAARKPAAKKSGQTAPAAFKTPLKTAPKALIKVAVKAPTNAKTTPHPKVEKVSKLKKPKLVRDSFTIPKVEYTVLDDLKQRATRLASPVKKSELIRAGVKALAAMSDSAFLATLKTVPTIKTGRPSKD
ncbi:MAG: hypothetical protein ACI9I0_002170 [Rhodoferax sp.]|jgi:hypothetical protein